MRVRLSDISGSPRGRGVSNDTLITAAVLAALAASAPAQQQFDELLKRALPPAEEVTAAVALGDVDGDGDLDMFLGNKRQSRLYLNDGTGLYEDATAARLPAVIDSTNAVALGDVDGDGDLDVVFGNGGQNRLYLNDGTGTYTDATAMGLPVDSDSTRAVALGDVDGDGDLDVVFGNGRQQNRLYLNDGTGIFTDATAARMPIDSDWSRAVALGDVDLDGDLDIVFGNSGNSFSSGDQNRLYLNDGQGRFTDATATRLPVDDDFTEALALGDVDGDGDLDLVTGNGADSGEQNRLYLNNGTGKYTNVTAARLPNQNDRTHAIALVDADFDGDLDMVLGNQGQQNRLYVNDGQGRFTDVTATRMPADNDSTEALALGDVDSDGDLDMALGNGPAGPCRLYLNEGAGTYVNATSARMSVERDRTRAVALGDVDADGDLDMVLGNWGRDRLYLNDGTGTYTDVTEARLPADSNVTLGVVMGDVDLDGDLDLVFGNAGGWQNRLYVNDGTGIYTDVTEARMPRDLVSTAAVALGDVDGDGDLDIVFGNRAQQDLLYVNDGTGTYTDVTAAQLPVGSHDTRAVALGDVDGDGDLDIVLGSGVRQQNRLYLNDGTGRYTDATAARMPADSDDTRAVALGDVDGDGDLDIVFGNGDWDRNQNRLYLNDGTGNYTDATAAHLPVLGDFTQAVALGDVDGDGDLDIVFGSYVFENRLYLNDGTGTYTDATAARMPVGFELGDAQAVALGDVDVDADLDIVLANEGQSQLYLNLQRQLDAPFLLRVGRTYTLEAYARSGPPSQSDFALPLLSTATASIPLPPYGRFGLEPTQMVALPPFPIPQPAGVGSMALTVPSVPSLAGLSLYAQALLLSYPFQERLTNVTGDVVIR